MLVSVARISISVYPCELVLSGQPKCALHVDLQLIDLVSPVINWHAFFSNYHHLCAWLQLEGVEPLASPDDCLLAEQIAKADPKVREMLKMRGVTDMDLVACDPWSGIHHVTQTLSAPLALAAEEFVCLSVCLSVS